MTPDNSRALSTEILDGHEIGRDPRKMSRDELASVGLGSKPLLRVIREKCLDCCCYQPTEIRKCVAVDCVLWPYRMGTNPFRKPLSDAERKRRAAVLQKNTTKRKRAAEHTTAVP